MTDEPTPTDWTSLWTALSAMDGAEWDAESDRLDALWLAEYKLAFVDYALTRGWSRENAEAWANESSGEALTERRGLNVIPAGLAREDVREIELGAA